MAQNQIFLQLCRITWLNLHAGQLPKSGVHTVNWPIAKGCICNARRGIRDNRAARSVKLDCALVPVDVLKLAQGHLTGHQIAFSQHILQKFVS
jgi:hypothetical protein